MNKTVKRTENVGPSHSVTCNRTEIFNPSLREEGSAGELGKQIESVGKVHPYLGINADSKEREKSGAGNGNYVDGQSVYP